MGSKKDIETCFNYYDRKRAFFSSDEPKWISRIHKLKEKFPDKVKVIKEPEDNDGCIYVELPTAWLRIQPKTSRVMTEEQRIATAERMKNLRLLKQK